MYNKSKVNTLFIVFIILLVIVAVIKLIDYNHGDRTFNSNIVSIDTSSVTSIMFYPKSENFKELKLEKSGRTWKLIFDKKTMYADMNIVKSVLSELSNMKTDRIAATDKSKWKDFGVDEKEGTMVKIKDKDKEIAALIIGKFAYNKSDSPYSQRGSADTYVRLMNDDKVYAVAGYLNMIFNRSVNGFRNGQLVSINKNDITKLTFMYPGDSSFVLAKDGNKWKINDAAADSAKTTNYINSISRLYSNEFADDINLPDLAKPVYTIKIEGNNANPIELKAYSGDASHKFVITSTMNENTKFYTTKNNIFLRAFISKSKLM